ncbi:AlpA family phage regulatory protein [Lysobacter arenosi]|uniref:AlpA family phage regulatory protein n=1 Tax=Lysobacter arenosi TaxID=2795387 RepID=A0ABX7RFP0_9GAMM|nr:AlpA family phage regulatory protein [Lysobacter arenosi]QSX75747.1 AlpA family phage regulatory protein [Lysobacter arenosi]
MAPSSLADSAFLRLPQIIGDAKATPPIPPLIPVSRSTFWAGVKAGRFPQPVKLSPGVTVWRAADLMRYIADAGKEA